MCESPRQGQGAVERGLAALLDAAVKDRIPRQAAILIEGKGESQHFALMVAKPEGLAQLVFLDQLIDEGDRASVALRLFMMSCVELEFFNDKNQTPLEDPMSAC